ncbi:bis(5'-nucleosyl)-tetraphosphatase (symmetrical) YqeK [Macrococcus equipercicus]|uniref:bis(5'-nucleosyl)-tetraphosphatase (symmetrical) n=1 Tax=Macrococcus equipercicus TaxID=69967 RepID=A0A9Q9F147_9STAP|nr:bis(5'-nucleosyl)-tetraphosphatase (symmetrical) YqeK [Macrococcus equipercicus]KAA1040050.1 HD domain-containing protein [Macrococcus equipercicus]UTH13001.1 bis(5'-nucleosyl)-tetraphosphatase (symmetrical) YqeK [Macrococcus equipercicus]
MKKKRAIKLVEEKLPKKRFEHSMRVAETAVKMADLFNGDAEKVELAGILHDYAKYDDLALMYQLVTKYELDRELLAYNSEILHGPVAAALMKYEHGIEDVEVLQAIFNHTTGRKQMTLTEKIIFVADYIEPGRNQPGVDEMRTMIFDEKKLDKAIYDISKRTVKFLLENDKCIYPRTIECLNYYNLEK